jgi:hypothetical protein
MESPEKYRSTIGFVDLLFNVLLGFVFLFIIAFVLINPIAKKENIKMPAEYMITLTWPDKDNNDLDLWVKDPMHNTVNFMRRESGFLNLDRDDLGQVNDTVMVNGEPVQVYINREVVTIRGIIPGVYLITVHLYSRKDFSTHPIPTTIEVIKMNPYTVVYKQTQELFNKGERVNFYQFTINSDGSFTDIRPSIRSAMD